MIILDRRKFQMALRGSSFTSLHKENEAYLWHCDYFYDN